MTWRLLLRAGDTHLEKGCWDISWCYWVQERRHLTWLCHNFRWRTTSPQFIDDVLLVLYKPPAKVMSLSLRTGDNVKSKLYLYPVSRPRKILVYLWCRNTDVHQFRLQMAAPEQAKCNGSTKVTRARTLLALSVQFSINVFVTVTSFSGFSFWQNQRLDCYSSWTHPAWYNKLLQSNLWKSITLRGGGADLAFGQRCNHTGRWSVWAEHREVLVELRT